MSKLYWSAFFYNAGVNCYRFANKSSSLQEWIVGLHRVVRKYFRKNFSPFFKTVFSSKSALKSDRFCCDQIHRPTEILPKFSEHQIVSDTWKNEWHSSDGRNLSWIATYREKHLLYVKNYWRALHREGVQLDSRTKLVHGLNLHVCDRKHETKWQQQLRSTIGEYANTQMSEKRILFNPQRQRQPKKWSILILDH